MEYTRYQAGSCILGGGYEVCYRRVYALGLSLHTGKTWPASVTLCDRSISAIHFIVADQLTLVLRSTQSLQLSVGLFRFCFGFTLSPSGEIPSIPFLTSTGLVASLEDIMEVPRLGDDSHREPWPLATTPTPGPAG